MSRGNSLLQIAYEIFPKTKGFKEFSDKRMGFPPKSVRDFLGEICPSVYVMAKRYFLNILCGGYKTTKRIIGHIFRNEL